MKLICLTGLVVFFSFAANANSILCQNSKMAISIDEGSNKVTFRPNQKTILIKNVLTSDTVRFRSISGEYTATWTVSYEFVNDSSKLNLKYVEGNFSEISASYTDAYGYPLSETLYCKQN